MQKTKFGGNMNVTADNVWNAVVQEPEFAMQPEEQKEVMKPFIEALPNVLQDELANEVTVESLLAAKIKFQRYCMKNGLITALCKVVPDAFEGMMESIFEQVIDMLEDIVADVPSFLEENGIDENIFLNLPQVGLNEQARKMYNEGNLTIGELLVTSPWTLLKSN